MVGKVLTQASLHVGLGFTINETVLQSKERRGLHGVEYLHLEQSHADSSNASVR